MIAIFPGMLVGFADEFVLRQHFKRLRFWLALLIRSIILTMLLVISILVFNFLFSILTEWIIGNNEIGVLKAWIEPLRGEEFMQLLLFYSLEIVVSLSIMQIRRYVGKGRLLSFLTGKYIHPTWENNMFMFVDLKASTTLADQFNSKKYSEFIRDFISDLSESIYVYNGRIYQYVGDEVVVYWPLSRNKKKNTRPIHCFVGMMQAISDREVYYREKYGVRPQFKAGLHGGPIIVAEVGDLKKEIAFHGTVINTTARIQSKCNELNTNFLISEFVKDNAQLSPDYIAFSEGKFLMKGKVEEMELFSVEKAEKEPVL
jgi:adenylate cyclase